MPKLPATILMSLAWSWFWIIDCLVLRGAVLPAGRERLADLALTDQSMDQPTGRPGVSLLMPERLAPEPLAELRAGHRPLFEQLQGLDNNLRLLHAVSPSINARMARRIDSLSVGQASIRRARSGENAAHFAALGMSKSCNVLSDMVVA
jgi:hypothetical protein